MLSRQVASSVICVQQALLQMRAALSVLYAPVEQSQPQGMAIAVSAMLDGLPGIQWFVSCVLEVPLLKAVSPAKYVLWVMCPLQTGLPARAVLRVYSSAKLLT